MRSVPATHIVIPDTQVAPGVPVDHLRWIGWYIGESYGGRKNVKICHLADHWDMPSLSSYDRGKRASEGLRYREDVQAGNDAMELLEVSMRETSPRRWWPDEMHFFTGNHEHRIERAQEDAAWLEGAVSLDDLRMHERWQRHKFLEPVTIDGVTYAHYFYDPMTGRPYGGKNVELRLSKIGHSFTMGHQQGLYYGMRSTVRGMQHGLVAGSCYLHDPEYLGPQAVNYWRGIVVCHQVENGTYSIMDVTLDYLCRRYEGVRLDEFMRKAYE